jgi:hypothetical protein
MMAPIMSHSEWQNRVCWTTREIARSPISPSEPKREQCIRETSTGFGPRTNAATRHSDNRRRRLTRWPMDRWPKPKNSKVDRANELRGVGRQPSVCGIVTHCHHPPSVAHTHSGSDPRAFGGVSHTLTRAHTPLRAQRATCRFNRSARTPPMSGRHTAAVPRRQNLSSPIRCATQSQVATIWLGAST